MNRQDFEERARWVLEDLSSPRPVQLEQVAGALPSLPMRDPEVGQLWRCDHPSGEQVSVLVLLTHVGRAIRGILATEHSWMAGHDDVVISERDSPIKRELMACVWSDLPIPAKALSSFLKMLNPEILEPILMLLQRQLSGGFRLRSRGPQTAPDAGLKWEIWPLGDESKKMSFVSGPRILGESDLRSEFRLRFMEAARWIEELAFAEVYQLEREAAEPEPSPRLSILDRLKRALDEVEWPDLRLPELDTLMPLRSPASLGAIPLTLRSPASLGIGCVLSPSPLSMLIRTASRDFRKSTPQKELLLRMNLPDCEMEISFQDRGESFSVVVEAVNEAGPFQGLLISLATEEKQARQRTDPEGLAWLGPFEVDPDGAPVTLQVGEGEHNRELRF